MSTAPMGPGWWRASDGRWYAPEQHPTWTPAPSAPAMVPPGGLVSEQPGGASVARPRRSWAIPIIVVLIVLLAGAGAAVYLRTTTSSSNSFATEPADQIAGAAQSAARAAGSVTIANSATASTGSRTTEFQVSTATTGSQHFGSRTARFQNRCVPGTCYVEGNAAGLEEAFKMPATLANAHAGRWLSLQAAPGTATELRQYRAVFASTTLPSLLSSALVPSGLQVEGTTTFDGQEVVALHGAHAAGNHRVRESGTWYVRADAPHLLLKSTGTATETTGIARFNSIYTAWGSTTAVVAPPTSIPFPITYEK